jgi:hypothetical protein
VSRLTIVLARLIGLYIVIVGLSIGVHKEVIDTVVRSPAVLIVLGLVALMAGLAIVLNHNVWRGGVLPVVITLVGWTILFRSVLLLVLPSTALISLLDAVHFESWFFLYTGGVIIVGLWLTYAGFSSRGQAGTSIPH